MLQKRLAAGNAERCWTAEGTAVFVDISGFTKLSERLARMGREGSEQIADAIGGSFESILLVAYQNGASLLKFGGDSLLLWFDRPDHAMRGCRACVSMRRVLRTAGRIEVPGARVTLRMSQGVHSGLFHFFSAGTSHLELLPIGPSWTEVVAMEKAAQSGEIVVSAQTAAKLPARSLGATRGDARLLVRDPAAGAEIIPLAPRPAVDADRLANCLSSPVRAHVAQGGGAPEHRPVTVAFVRLEGTDAFIASEGAAATGEALQAVVAAVSAACEAHGVTPLASDVDSDGGKLILTAGVPSATGNDEERMLLALRAIADARLPIALRIGVHRGAVFAGDIGPFYRRTYTIMGDAVNLAARVMAKAEPGHVYATADVLDRSDTLFETQDLAPFAVKGKAQPVRAWSVGRAIGSRSRQGSLESLPLTGRDAELALAREALAAARSGTGKLLDVVGEAGVGKTRLLEVLREEAAGFRQLHAVCEVYSKSTPYALWRELLRELMGFGRDDPDAQVEARVRAELVDRAPDLVPWWPLLAIAFGLDVGPTPQIEQLTEDNRRIRMRELVTQFLSIVMPDPTLIEIENAHNMDVASSELLSHLTTEVGARPWIVGVARRVSGEGFKTPKSPAVVHIELQPLGHDDALRMAQAAAEQHPMPLHLVEIVARRSGGNPQFLRDLARAAIASGGGRDLPDSAEAATIARIDALLPEDRALVRRAAVFGMTFHPRMLPWLSSTQAAPDGAAWSRLQEIFDEEPDGYLRFHRSLVRDAAYEGLPYKERRRLHGIVAERIEEEAEDPADDAGILSLHFFEAGRYDAAWRYSGIAARHAQSVYAHVEAAELYGRAIDAGRKLEGMQSGEIAATMVAEADSWYRATVYDKAADGYVGAHRMVKDSDPVASAGALLKRSRVEEKLGKPRTALRWAARARDAVEGLESVDAIREAARSSALYASLLQRSGRNADALRWGERAVAAAKIARDDEALGGSFYTMGGAKVALGASDEALEFLQRSLDAYERAGNVVRQAGLLSDLGVACQQAGRWDEALSYYQRSHALSTKIGNLVTAALARINMAEILIDRGEFAEAEEQLQQTMPLWKASRYRFYLAACLSLLGRVSLRAGRFDEALKRLTESRDHFVAMGITGQVPPVDARIAECRACLGDTDGAISLVDEMLRQPQGSGLAPLLLRARAYALQRRGDHAGARQALDASVAAARSRNDPFEIALTLSLAIKIAETEGTPPRADFVGEANMLIERLKIRALPAMPPFA
jgi:class 3 adenylate cyclase/tetratricopeptide (TPR) repeat protein